MEEMQKEIASISKEESEITSLSGDGRKIVPDFERNNDSLKQYDLNENDSSTMETTAAKKPKTVLKMTTSPLHYNTIGSYLAAKQEETELKYRPVWDSSPQCMMRDTVQIRTALSKMEERTQRKNAEHENRRTQINKMIQDLRSDQEQLTEHLIKYSEFLDENAEKKQRSKEIIAREEELSKDLDEQIAFAEEELLQGIVMGAIEGKKVFVERIQVEGARYAKQLNEYKSQIIDKNNLITSLSVRSDTAQKELRYWTGIVDKVDQQTETSMSDLQSVKDACWNMYVQMCDHSGRPVTLTEDQTIKQLNHIVKEILDKRRLINIFKRLQTSDITSKPSKTKQPAKNN
ncbi:uncharacterized protein LOC111051418 isoform X3 [Nilaparvata lugens]|uniref:uncharacterized protein LOC111051418 isoform X3 n=1 Tax=Nilaparvata lugens TaxID=108931 RepID=UPI00193E2D73|nr:uncharacterized protein LOC111051418 isoform X3 [Nilaparvata lugens]